MLGIEGIGVFLAYLLSILSAGLCVVYGIVNWNNPRESQEKEIDEEVKWEKTDDMISEKL